MSNSVTTATHVLASVLPCAHQNPSKTWCRTAERSCSGCLGDGTRAVVGDTPIHVTTYGIAVDMGGRRTWMEVEGS